MRSTFAGFVVGSLIALIAIALGTHTGSAHAERLSPPYGAAGPDIDVFHSTDGRQVTVVDRGNEVMAVYGIDAKTHEITLRSVRNFRWDLRMEVFNGMDPKPKQIRALIDKSR